MAGLAALVPPPRMHLTRYHGVFAPRSKLRAAVTPAHRGVGAARQPGPGAEEKPPMPPHVAMNWARRLKRVFGIEIETCAGCGRAAAHHRQHRGSGGHHQDSFSPGALGFRPGAGAIVARGTGPAFVAEAALGLHRMGLMWIYISRGTGYWGPPMRFGIPSEITRIRRVRG